MNPNDMILHPSPSQVSVIRFDEINNPQVVPLHILENDLSSEMLIPHVYITEAPLPMFIGSEKINSAENPVIPILDESKAKSYPQYCNILATDKLHTLAKSLSPESSQKSSINIKKPYIDIIPKSSKHFAINKQIELYPINYTFKSPLQNSEQVLTRYPNVKLKPDPCINEPNPASLLNGLINHSLDTQDTLDLLVDSQPLNNPHKPIKRKTNLEKNLTDNDISSKPPAKRKVQNYVHISDVRVPQRAVAVLPTALQIRGKDNIFPRRSLPMRIRFGPIEGSHKVVTSAEVQNLVSKTDTPVFLLKKDDEIVHIDVSDKDKCNWMGLLPLGGEANVWLYQENDELYGITTEPINARRPLKLGYSKKYAEEHKLPPGIPTMDLEIVLSSNPKQWWCNECNRALPSAPLLQRHADVYHKDDIISTRKGYRCMQCRRMFSRLFTLRRHLSKHCTKKSEKPADTKESKPALDLNSTLNEDNRLPSDESFQNFTNGLDFSTSLFDTDRISNLDISGNSRADDFNPYDITFRDDTCTSNDLSFAKLTSAPTRSNEAKKEPSSDACAHCNQVLKKQNKRKHMKECPSRKLECACGRFFRNSEKLAQHFLKEHAGDDSKTNLPEKKKYTCEQCKSKRVSFKRRGMLVNHLWRAHKIVSTSKVELPVRHYPCVACSKIYRSAAKRDRHIVVHHPGAEKLRTQSIEGGVRSCEPAACGECPRQYATRAKLLQHIRIHHQKKANKEQPESKNPQDATIESIKVNNPQQKNKYPQKSTAKTNKAKQGYTVCITHDMDNIWVQRTPL